MATHPPSSEARGSSRAFDNEAQQLADALRAGRLTVLVGAGGLGKTTMLATGVLPLLRRRVDDHPRRTGATRMAAPVRDRRRPASGSDPAEVVFFFDQWRSNAPLASLDLLLDESVGNGGGRSAHVDAATAAWPTRLSALARHHRGARLLFVFDHFEQLLESPTENAAAQHFVDEWVQALKAPGLRANFLVALDDRAWPRLEKLGERIPGFGEVRLFELQTRSGKVTLERVRVAGAERRTEAAVGPEAADFEASLRTMLSKFAKSVRQADPVPRDFQASVDALVFEVSRSARQEAASSAAEEDASIAEPIDASSRADAVRDAEVRRAAQQAEAKRSAEAAAAAAEARRIDEELRRAEAERVAEAQRVAQARRAAEAEAARKAEAQRIADAEAKRVAEAAAAEAKRIADEAAAAEAGRMAEEFRRAEAERVAEAQRVAQARRAAEVEAARKAEAQRIAEAEAKRIAEQAAAETRRIAEEAAAAEARRIDEELRRAEAERVAELQRVAQARRAAEAEAQRIADAAEAKRIAEAEEAAAAEAQRIADELRRAEAERVAELQRLAQAQRAAEAETKRIAELAAANEATRVAEAAAAAARAKVVAEAVELAAKAARDGEAHWTADHHSAPIAPSAVAAATPGLPQRRAIKWGVATLAVALVVALLWPWLRQRPVAPNTAPPDVATSTTSAEPPTTAPIAAAPAEPPAAASSPVSTGAPEATAATPSAPSATVPGVLPDTTERGIFTVRTNAGGSDARIAGELARAIGGGTASVRTVPAAAGFDAIESLRAPRSLAIARYDALRAARRSASAPPLRVLAPMYAEEVVFIVRADSRLKFIHDLRGRRINVGSAREGSGRTVREIYRQMFGTAMTEPSQLDKDEALAELVAFRSIDAMVLVGAQPSAWLASLNPRTARGLRVLRLDRTQPEDRKVLQEFQTSVLRAGPGVKKGEGIPTLATMTYLVASGKDEADAKQLTDMVDALCRELPRLRAGGHPKWRELRPSVNQDTGWPVVASAQSALKNCASAGPAPASKPAPKPTIRRAPKSRSKQ